MSGTPHPYAGQVAALATKHGKERAIAPALAQLPLVVEATSGLDTDELGTFTGEIERPAPPRETALIKARLGCAHAGTRLGLASEGSFGPHPRMPLVGSGLEVLALVDEGLGTAVVESELVSATNFAAIEVEDEGDERIATFLDRCGFPAHAVIVRPGGVSPEPGMVRKGIGDRDGVEAAVDWARRSSPSRSARLETDMRAHVNPTRMAAIARLAERLAERLGTLCAACGTPGYGRTGVERGLPCEACATPTELVAFELFGCPACDAGHRAGRGDGLSAADPGRCPRCNP